MISATIGVELPCPIQVRVAEAHVIHKIVNVLDPKAPDDELVEGMKALARALCPKTKEQLRNERLMKFEAVNPRFDAVLYQLMDGVAVDSAFSHSPSGGMLALINAPAPTTPVPEFNASGQIVLAASQPTPGPPTPTPQSESSHKMPHTERVECGQARPAQ